MANQDCLVLNTSWVPIETVSWQSAITKIFNGKAYSAKDYDAEIKTTNPDIIFMKPAVIVLYGYNKIPNRTLNYSKRLVYYRDKFICQYCGKQLVLNTATIDHITPRCRGGYSTFENTVTSCESCNKRKANKNIRQANMRLRKKPSKPKINPIVIKFSRIKINKEWEEHLEHWLGI